MPRASRLGEEITRALGIEVELVPGGGGIYEISADGRLLFSKKQEGRFPTDEEIIAGVRRASQ